VTLFTSVKKKPKQVRQPLKTALVYLMLSAFCILFDNVYAIFGHGVRSASMSLMFLYPLLGGALVFFLLRLFVPDADQVRHYRFSYNIYNSGIAVLTVRSLLDGIFEIAGTSSDYLAYFTLFGWIFAAAGLITYLSSLYRRSTAHGQR
jgi:hypothetical protein